MMPASPAETTTPPRESRWEVFVHAVRGTGGDPTRGPLTRAIVLLAVPMVLEMVMESLFAVVDIFFVSRLGDQAVAGVALTESLLTVVYTAAMGLSIGVTAMVARRIGEGDEDGAARATVQAVILGASVALVIAVIGATWAQGLLRLMGADEATVAVATPYARLALGTNIVVILLFLLNATFRGAGDAAIAMRVLWIGNGINMVLDPMFIFGVGPFPELGIQGAAVATAIGRGTAVAIQLYTLFRLGTKVRVLRRHLRADGALILRIVRLSATGTLQVFIGTASWIGLVRLVAEFGSEALAGYAIAVRIILFALLPAWGLANAAATMVGQGLGAKDPQRAERAVWIAGAMNAAFLGAVGVLFVTLSPQIVSLFGGSAAAGGYAASCLRIISIGFVFYGFGMVLVAAFNGAGAVWTPTIINFFCFWLWEIPLAWVLATRFGWGPPGIFVAMTIAFSSTAVVAGVVFRRGNWKTVTV
ncbi:MAG: MATE family efflux transporter [Gemmatimonadales bacterium]